MGFVECYRPSYMTLNNEYNRFFVTRRDARIFDYGRVKSRKVV